MAKDQGISLTPTKLSGRCGKLKCCLAYEADTYREYLEEVALRVGHTVRTPKGYAKVIDLNVIARKVRVSTLSSRDMASFSADQVERVKGGITQGDEKSGFYYGPDGKPEPPPRPQRSETSEPRRTRSRDNERSDSRPKRQARSETPAKPAGETGEDGKPKRRRRRRSRGPRRK